MSHVYEVGVMRVLRVESDRPLKKSDLEMEWKALTKDAEEIEIYIDSLKEVTP